MGSRTMPVECEHGAIIDWGDFGDEASEPEPCSVCDALNEEASAEMVALEAFAELGELIYPALKRYLDTGRSSWPYGTELEACVPLVQRIRDSRLSPRVGS